MVIRTFRYFALAAVFAAVMLCGRRPMYGERHPATTNQPAAASSQHDFDFLVGSWTVQHRRLKQRLAHSKDWETFSGTCQMRLALGGQANTDDNVLRAPAGTYRAVSLRSFDPQSRSWAIWWLDSRHPNKLDPPVVGGFRNGVGTFVANDTFNGRPILVRYIWSDITHDSAKWQQAFSDNGGKSWETNWIMDFHRAPEQP